MRPGRTSSPPAPVSTRHVPDPGHGQARDVLRSRRQPVDARAAAPASGVVELESYTFVLLRRPPDAPDLPDEELERLQQQHLAYLAQMAERGAMVLSGPFDGQPDESWRGFSLYVTSVEETRELVAQDPSVQAGRLAVDVFTWWTRKGALGRGS